MKKLLLLTALAVSPAAAQQVTTLPAQDKVLPGKPVTQFSIGAEDGEDWELLSRVSQVAFDREENLYVLDAGNHRVLVFNPQGKFVRKFGKKGGGPGELMSPVGLAVTTAGEVAVTDLGRPAVSLFKRDGSFIKNLPLGDELGFPVPQATFAHPGGGVVVRTMPPIMRRGAPDEIGAARTMTNRKSPLTWLTTEQKQTKLFEIPQPDITPKVTDNSAGANNRQVAVRIQLPAFSAPTLWGVLPNGTVAVTNDLNYKLQLARNGKIERTIQRPITARKVTEADKNREKARRREQMSRGGGMVFATTTRDNNGPERSSRSVGGTLPKAEIDRMLADLTFNEYVPVLAGLYADSRGRLWVQRTGKEVGTDGPIDLISANGQYIGTLVGQKLPAAVSLTGRAAYIERDDMDVEQVVVKKLPVNW